MRQQQLLAIACFTALSASAGVHAQPVDAQGFGPGFGQGGHVYVMSNAKGANEVAVLRRDRVGGLDKLGVYRTGGQGVGVGTTAPPPDPLGSQNALVLSDDGRFLFAVNAGSNEVSTFLVFGDRLVLLDVTDSGGSFPVSLAQRGDKLYVLNSAGHANVTAFHIDLFGRLSPVRGSSRVIGTDSPLVGNQPDVATTATQLQFDRSGRWLAVAVKDSASKGFVELFAVDGRGNLAQDPEITPSNDTAPFGFAFDDENHLLMSQGGASAVISYAVERDGGLRTLSPSLASGQAATCWLAANRHYAFTANAGSSTVSAYRVDDSGKLSLLESGVAANLGAGHAPTDLKLTKDGRSLYVNSPGAGSVVSFAVGDDGRLKPVGETPVFAAFSGMQGLAVQ
jgi:6-phosphogluconolactonase (cycloisomerase 2 family)